MKSWRDNLPTSKTIPVLVLFALLLSLISQNHLHLNNESTHNHHDSLLDEASHTHAAIDVHTSYDESHSLTHPDVQTVTLQPEAWVKYMNDDLGDIPLIALLITFILLLPNLRGSNKYKINHKRKRSRRYFNLPVLRAPPVCA